MLFVFNRMNAIHIAWNSRGPSARSQNNQNGNGRVTFIRTWSAG